MMFSKRKEACKNQCVALSVLCFAPLVASCENKASFEEQSSESVKESKQAYDENEILEFRSDEIQDYEPSINAMWWTLAKTTRKCETVKSVDVYFGNSANIIGANDENDSGQIVTFTLWRNVYSEYETKNISTSKEILSLRNVLGFFAGKDFSYRINHMIDHISADELLPLGEKAYINYSFVIESNDGRPVQLYNEDETIFESRVESHVTAPIYYGFDDEQVYFRCFDDK